MDNSQKTVFALHKKYPDSEFSVHETYETLSWLTEKYPKPTKAEFNEAVKEYKDDYDAKQYQRDRASAFDPIPEQLDQIYHDIDGWKAKIKSVKDKYPKPT